MNFAAVGTQNNLQYVGSFIIFQNGGVAQWLEQSAHN